MEVAFCSIDDFACRVGVCRNTVKKWLQQGLPAVKAGRVWRIRIEHADAWLLAGAAQAVHVPARVVPKATRTRRSVPAFSPKCE